EDDAAAVGHDIAGHQVEERRLAGAIGADEARDRAALDPERTIVHRRKPAEMLRDVLYVDHCVEGHPFFPIIALPAAAADFCGICSQAAQPVNLDQLVKWPREQHRRCAGWERTECRRASPAAAAT